MTARGLPADAYRIFSQALDLPESERQRYIDSQCGGNAALRQEVVGLLGVALDDVDATAAFRTLPPADEPELIGLIVGRFRLVERLGAGGMGVVYRAERTDGVQQSVAIKLLSNELDARARPRFEREAQMLARLEHPAIARLIDAGIKDERAWIAIEFVKGQRIDGYCAEQRLAVPAIVRLVVEVADAVAASHRLLVVHSDIKPANVLVNADGLPKLVDFGIATALRDGGEEQPATGRSTRLFSPNYAAPEQIEGGIVTVATDVFGLGALAYRLLTGSPPYANAADSIAYYHAVTRGAVEAPSEAARAAGQDPTLIRALKGDLDAILEKAMSRDPAGRYATAQEFAADLRRYLSDEPVQARPPSWPYRTFKFVRRHAVAAGAACVLLFGASVGITNYVIQQRNVAQARNIALQRGHFLEELLQSANPVSGRRDITVAELLDKVMKQTDAEIDPEPLVVASLLGIVARTNHALGRFNEAVAATDRQIALLERNHGSALDRAAAQSERGTLAWRTGHPNEAIEPLQAAVRLSGGDCASGGHVYAETLENLGNVFEQVQRLDEAAVALHGSLDCARSMRSPQGRSQEIDTLNDLMVLEQLSGHTAAALADGREAVALARQYLSPNNPQRYIPVLNLAVIIVAKGSYAEAESMYREVLTAETRLLGPDHSDTLVVMANLADDLLRMHRPKEAVDLALKSARGLEKAGGLMETHTISAWQIYGQATCLTGNPAEGLPLLRRSVALRTETDGENGWRTLSSRLVLGICLASVHQNVEAESLLLGAAAGLEKLRGTSFLRTQDAYAALRDLYLDWGKPAESARWAAKLEPPANPR